MRIERKIREEVDESIKVAGVTLLSVDEYETAKEYIPPIKGWWWLRSPGDYRYYAAYVHRDGRVLTHGNNVYGAGGVVRPALSISNLDSLNLKSGDRLIDFCGFDWTVISARLAICDTGIGTHCFQEDWRAPDANDYEKSDVKNYLESWAAKNGIICGKKMEE